MLRNYFIMLSVMLVLMVALGLCMYLQMPIAAGGIVAAMCIGGIVHQYMSLMSLKFALIQSVVAVIMIAATVVAVSYIPYVALALHGVYFISLCGLIVYAHMTGVWAMGDKEIENAT